jgi:hypothetical protein
VVGDVTLQQEEMAMENIFRNTWKKFYTLIYNMVYHLDVERSKTNNTSKVLKTFSFPT